MDNKDSREENNENDGKASAATDQAAARGIFSPPRRLEFLYLLPILLSVVVTFLAMNGDRSQEDIGRSNNILLCMIMIIEMAFLMFVHPRMPKWCGWILFAAAPPCATLLMEYMSHDLSEMKTNILWLNIAFMYILAAIVLSITRRTSFAVLVPCLYALIAGLAEHYVILFRSVPLFPWDLASIGVAATVVGNYEFVVTSSLATMVTALCFIMFLCFFMPTTVVSLKKVYLRIVSCAASFALMFGYVSYMNTDRIVDDFGLYPYLFTPLTVYYRNGFTVAFLTNLRYARVDKPSGYSRDAVEAIASEEYTPSDKHYSDVENPNIIVIMDEAFSDLKALGEFETNQDYMPFIHSLSEDTIKGTMHVSVLGGNTPNTEFEFLTGLSMAFLPPGSIPYQQYIKSELPSLASQLAGQGYHTLAIHPYIASGWDRNTVYPHLGFDEMMFQRDLRGMSVIRSYISDASVFRYMAQRLESKETDDPMFIFNVTMQNHGAYTTQYDNFNDREVTVNGLEGEQQISQYLSLIKKTDAALMVLCSELEDFDEPTIVMFFGDHQPGTWVSSAMRNKYGIYLDDSDINQHEQFYEVPFLLWANYDIENEGNVGDISVNYLSTLLCEVANIELTDAQKFLSSLHETYPSVSANSFMDKYGYLYPISDAEDEELLKKYSILQYNCLFDGNTSGMFE